MSDLLFRAGLRAAERGLVPDFLLRRAIRRLCEERIELEDPGTDEGRQAHTEAFIERMNAGPVAPVPELANEQHYEVPAKFFEAVLGPHLKYSCCYWESGAKDLGEAEAASLELTCEHAHLRDGQDVLELGCGWGSLSLWMAEHYPGSRITSVSNSASQREFIEGRARKRGLENLRVTTCDMNDFDTASTFDRVVSVEMFEHMRNYRELLKRISTWMRPGGELMIHVFCHREVPYEFHREGDDNWMGKYFFSGGIMPSQALLPQFAEDLHLAEQWSWSGTNYEQTANAWLKNLDKRRDSALSFIQELYGSSQRDLWFQRWRLFFLACAELWGYDAGREWLVSHYSFRRSE